MAHGEGSSLEPTLGLGPDATPARGTRPRASGLAPGQVVAGRYRIVRFLARGGVGEVWEAEELEIGAVVALKVLQSERAVDDDTTERFKREIQLARRVTHRNVCRLLDAGRFEDSGSLYLTMELLEGETLEARLDRRERLPAQESLDLARQLAGAIDAAHEVGVIHRDFKTGNVILVPDEGGGERAVVTDFGLARAVDPDPGSFRTSKADLMGTPSTMAPEQVSGETTGPRTDVYALGVVLYRMVTGRNPFVGRNVLETAFMRLDQDPAPPQDLVPDLPPGWSDVILRALARRPKDRYPTAGAMVDALERAVRPRARKRAPSPLVGAAGWIVAAVLLGTLLWTKWAPVIPEGGTRSQPLDVQLTTDPGLELDVDLAPGGDRVAYAADRSGDFELYVRPLAAAGTELKLTGGGQSFQPRWSPDARYLAYTSRSEGGVWVVPALGGAPRQVAPFGSRPSWSPSGSELAFQEDGSYEIADRASPAMPPSTIWIVASSGGEPRQLTLPGVPVGGHGEPVWAPDGFRLAFSTGDRRGAEIWRVDRDGGRLAPMIQGWRIATHPLFDAAGRYLYFTGIPGHVREATTHGLFRIAIDGDLEPTGEAESIVDLSLATIRQFSLAADGETLAYAALSSASNLWLAELSSEGSVVSRSPLTSGRGRNNRPVFSPTGDRLAFDRWLIGQNLDVWVLEPTSEPAPRSLTSHPDRDSQASWSADGRSVYFTSDRNGTRALFLVEIDTGRTKQVLELDDGIDWVRVSPDEHRVAYNSTARGGIGVVVQELHEGGRREWVGSGESLGFPAWSPDGRFLACEQRRGDSSDVAVVDLATDEVDVLTDEEGLSWPYSWSPDGDRVAYAALRDGTWSLRAVSRTTGRTEELLREPRLNAYLRYPAWAPSGDRLAYEVAETVGDLWLLENVPP